MHLVKHTQSLIMGGKTLSRKGNINIKDWKIEIDLMVVVWESPM